MRSVIGNRELSNVECRLAADDCLSIVHRCRVVDQCFRCYQHGGGGRGPCPYLDYVEQYTHVNNMGEGVRELLLWGPKLNKTDLQPISRPEEQVHYFGGWVEGAKSL